MARPTLRTELCDRLGIEYPILLAGMGPVAGTGDPVATADLVAGRDVTLNASMAKLKTSRLARQLTDTCLQFWGGQGYMAESTTAQFYRDLRLHSIGGGADEIMLQIIAKRLDLRSL